MSHRPVNTPPPPKRIDAQEPYHSVAPPPHQHRRFRALLDDPSLLESSAQGCGLPGLPPLITPDKGDADAVGATLTMPATGNELASAAPDTRQATPGREMPLAATLDQQTLALRATTGPLAGLTIQATWGQQRLSLRLASTNPTIAARLALHRTTLQSALEAALGVHLQLEVAHDHG